MDSQERTPREKKIRRAIVVLSSSQTMLGVLLIATSFTAFASTSSEKLRGASPYWAGFTVLFTGAVGFLTWKQLSIISIGIYTFLSATSVIVHLVATILTGDSAGLLNSLHACKDQTFDHACECCKVDISCAPASKYTFPNVRDCDILTGFLKDLFYGLCTVNVVCCLICLTVTVMGCTLVAQYNRYSRTYRYRLTRRSGQDAHDHRYDWFPYSPDSINAIPPCAPPIYHPVQNNAGDPGPQCRRPPTVFDSVDFPPPYTSRAPSLSETLDWEQISLEENAEGGPQFSGRQAQIPAENGYQTYEHPTEGRESEISAEFDRGNSVASRDHEVQHSGGVEGELGSPLGAAWSIEGCVPDVSSVRDDNFSGSLDVESGVYLQLPRGSQETELPDDHEVASINSDSGSPNDDVFTSSSSLGEGAYPKEAGTSRSDTQFLESDRGGRWDSCPHNCQQTTSDEIYCAHNEIYTSVVPPNVNPWGRTMSEQDAGASCGRASPQHAKFRSNSIPCLPASQDRVLKLHKGCQTPDVIAGETSGEAEPADCEGDGSSAKRSASHEEPGGLFRHFKESNATRQGRHKRRKRPRNNPGHILEKETGKSKTIGKGDAVVLTEPSVSNIGETNV